MPGGFDPMQDTFRYAFLVVPCLLLALVLNHRFTFTEVRRCGQHRWVPAPEAIWQLC